MSHGCGLRGCSLSVYDCELQSAEAATEAAQAEVVRLRQAVETVRDDMAIAADLSDPPHVVEYAIVIKRLAAALKETP